MPNKYLLYLLLIISSAILFPGKAFSSDYAEKSETRLLESKDFFLEASSAGSFSQSGPVADTTQQLINKINDLAAYVTLENRFIEKLDETIIFKNPY